ncbi:type III sulfide quinone reductase, selenoprotein subtype [Longivirga aurantiaca]|uniref:NAD(P)/FAD-dependent oxidoreductase n=1 Tax=Longivirga aurantiaca TaxID=1837743 RepID=A0ABW1SYW4_9ACTN
MKHLLILGGGTAGTITANKLRKKLSKAEWDITVVDRDDKHDYQPGYLFIPFGIYQPDEVTKSRRKYLSDDIPLIYAEIDRVDAEAKTVSLVDGRVLPYDQLVIATGVTPRPDQTPGMDDEGSWYDSVFDFYTHAGTTALAEKLKTWEGGRLVVNIVEMPIKCPVAPLEFTFLADAFFVEKGMRDKVEIVYVTPLDAAFTKPIAAKAFGTMLEDKGVRLEPEFMLERVDTEAKTLVSYDEREVPYDLLVTIPLNMGADFIARSGLGNELNLVPVDKQTLLSKKFDSIFVLGDANDIPASKAGSVAHFEIEGFVENFMEHIAGRSMTHKFDGHANCFIETGHGKAMLIDFNYDTEPMPGKFPVPGVGPMSLLKETKANHLGKLGFRWAYWNVLMPGRPMPISADLQMAGKKVPVA